MLAAAVGPADLCPPVPSPLPFSGRLIKMDRYADVTAARRSLQVDAGEEQRRPMLLTQTRFPPFSTRVVLQLQMTGVTRAPTSIHKTPFVC